MLTALLLHAALTLRWACVPLGVVYVAGSLVVAFELGGQYCGWALLVVCVDLVVVASRGSAVNIFPHRLSFVPRLVLTSLVLGFVVAPAALLLDRVASSLGFPVVGKYVAVAFSFIGVAAAAITTIYRGRAWIWLYVVWAIFGCLLEVCVSIGLLFAASYLIADRWGRTVQSWLWLWRILQVNCLVSFISTAIQLAVLLEFAGLRIQFRRYPSWLGWGRCPILVFRWYPSPATAVGDMELHGDGGGFGPVASLVDETVGNVSDATIMPPPRKRYCYVSTFPFAIVAVRLTALLLLGVVALWLFVATFSFLRYSAGLPGVVVTKNLPPPICDSCYCQPRFPDYDVREVRDVVYRHAVDSKTGRSIPLRLDVISAWDEHLGGSIRAPAVIIIHGGAFLAGDKNITVLRHEATELAKRGFVAFLIDYRLEGTFALPMSGAVFDAVADAKAAVRFIVERAAQYNVDPHRIAGWGSSAGAIIAGSMNYIDDDSAEASGQTMVTSSESPAPRPRANITAAVGVSGCLWPFSFGSLAEPLSLIPWFDVHGDHDFTVPVFLAAVTYRYLSFLGAPSADNKLAIVPGGGHVPWLSTHGDGTRFLPTLQETPPANVLRQHVVAFLVRAMGLEGAAC